jgi:hypothetical protein
MGMREEVLAAGGSSSCYGAVPLSLPFYVSFFFYSIHSCSEILRFICMYSLNLLYKIKQSVRRVPRVLGPRAGRGVGPGGEEGGRRARHRGAAGGGEGDCY